MTRPDVLIVGGGVIGGAVTYELGRDSQHDCPGALSGADFSESVIAADLILDVGHDARPIVSPGNGLPCGRT